MLTSTPHAHDTASILSLYNPCSPGSAPGSLKSCTHHIHALIMCDVLGTVNKKYLVTALKPQQYEEKYLLFKSAAKWMQFENYNDEFLSP